MNDDDLGSGVESSTNDGGEGVDEVLESRGLVESSERRLKKKFGGREVDPATEKTEERVRRRKERGTSTRRVTKRNEARLT